MTQTYHAINSGYKYKISKQNQHIHTTDLALCNLFSPKNGLIVKSLSIYLSLKITMLIIGTSRATAGLTWVDYIFFRATLISRPPTVV